ncbi:hypothetical protein PoB_005799100 [Plakobranchus ocellatus]|uniref:Uncharacterized protein n=1 Tax=Plakobranchus ocellatus TaxID=259542 RepID=A0AAV4CJ32_9GAST|nr:hypothetical protein PoB_005799100 [Plakobranchus ocellatus]
MSQVTMIEANLECCTQQQSESTQSLLVRTKKKLALSLTFTYQKTSDSAIATVNKVSMKAVPKSSLEDLPIEGVERFDLNDCIVGPGND